MLTYQCHNMRRKLWIDSNILDQKYPNMPNIAGESPVTEKDSKWHHVQTAANLLTKNHQNNTVYCRNHDIISPVGWPNNVTSNQKISRVQSKPTRATEKKIRMLLDYVATYPNAIIWYKASDMVQHVDSYAAYIIMPDARICYSGHLCLSDCPSPSPIKPNPGETDLYTQTVKQHVM